MRGRGVGSYCLMGTEFQFYRKKVLEVSCNTHLCDVNTFNTTVRLEMVTMANFMLSVS